MEQKHTSNVSVILRETPQRFGIKSDTHTTTFVLHVLQCHILKDANVWDTPHRSDLSHTTVYD
jgi:hypothetical protein